MEVEIKGVVVNLRKTLFVLLVSFFSFVIASAQPYVKYHDDFRRDVPNFSKFIDDGKFLLFTTGDENRLERELFVWEVGTDKGAKKLSDKFNIDSGIKFSPKHKAIIYMEVEEKTFLKAFVLSQSSEPYLLADDALASKAFFISHDGLSVIYSTTESIFSTKIDLSENAVNLTSDVGLAVLLSVSLERDKIIYLNVGEGVFIKGLTGKSEPIKIHDCLFDESVNNLVQFNKSGDKIVFVLGDSLYVKTLNNTETPKLLFQSTNSLKILKFLSRRNSVVFQETQSAEYGPSDFVVYEANISTLDKTQLGHFNGLHLSINLFTRNEKYGIATLLKGPDSTDIIKFDFDRGSWLRLSTEYATATLEKISNDQKYLIFSEWRTSHTRYGLHNLNDVSKVKLTDKAIFMPDTKSMIVAINNMDHSNLYLRDINTGADIKKIFSANSPIQFHSVSPDGKYLIFSPTYDPLMLALKINTDDNVIPLNL